MISEYDQLYRLLKTQAEDAGVNDEGVPILNFEINDNATCSLILSATKQKMTFMLGRMGDEYKVGYALYPAYIRQPDWIDDVDAANFNAKFARQLIWTNFNLE